MNEPLAYFDGRFVPASQMAVPVTDTGFMMGTTVAEQVRTFRGRLFRLEQHLDRLEHSLYIVGVRAPCSRAELAQIAEQLVAHNHQLLEDGDDLGLSIFITPGPYPTFCPESPPRPLVGMHTYPLPFGLWHERYEAGQSLRIPQVRQVPSCCWPAELKCRSRMHYFLADRQAQAAEPGSRAVLLDLEGNLTEASTANLVIFRRDEGLVSPPAESILPGISLQVLKELAAGTLHTAFRERPLKPADVWQADEAMLCSTSPCLLPVVRLDGRPIGGGKPGPFFRRALAAWSEMVGVDIAGQARRFARR